MFRRLMGGRASKRSSDAEKRLPNLDEDDNGGLLCDEKVQIIGRSHGDPSHGCSSTASTATYSTGTRSPPAESSSSGDNEELRSAFRNPLSRLMGSKQGSTSRLFRGDNARSESEDDGAGLGFGHAVGSSSCCASSEDAVLFTIFRSPLFSRDGNEEKLEVELSRSLTVAGLRQQIAALYGIPEAAQRLQSTPDLGGDRLSSKTPLEKLVHQPIFLLPADVALEDSGMEFERRRVGHRRAAEDEQAAMIRGVMESLQGVKYKFHVALPQGLKSGVASRTLSLDALARVGDVQIMLEMELTGGVGKLPLMMVFNGQAVPADVPLHFAGVRDGSTLALVMADLAFAQEPAWDEDDFEDDPVLAWAAR